MVRFGSRTTLATVLCRWFLALWFAKNPSGAKTQVSISIASGSREPRRPDSGHVTLCYMVVGGNLNSPLNLFISFAKALMEQGFPSDPFLAKEHGLLANHRSLRWAGRVASARPAWSFALAEWFHANHVPIKLLDL